MNLTKFFDPKKIFGTEKNKGIFIHFLNDVLIFKEKKSIMDVNFLKTVQDPEISAQKTSIINILCQDHFLLTRSLSYVAGLYMRLTFEETILI